MTHFLQFVIMLPVMANIFVISSENYNLEEYNVKTAGGFYENLYDDILNFEADVVILDSSIQNSNLILVELLARNINKDRKSVV